MSISSKRYKFSNQINAEFFTTLRNRVNAHFVSNNIPKHGNHKIVIKTVVMFLLYFIPYVIIVAGWITQPYLYIGLWLIMGLGGAGIGVNVMHDANHGVWSRSKWWNKTMGKSVNLIGGNDRTWQLQHNVLHHAYTNVDGMDHDLEAPVFLRFSPHQELRWFHRFQYIYAWFFYGMQTFARAFATDFVNAVIFKRDGLIRTKKEYRKVMRQIIFGKIIYFTYILAIPLIFSPVSWWLVLLGFSIMHYVTGFMLSVIFQTAHVMPDCEFPIATNEGVIENNWAVHQMQTTTNFSPNSKIFSWFIGGLNFQIEHHLFANICHTHYRDISKIVADTAHEFGVQYNQQKNFVKAVWEHGKMLKLLGKA